MVARFEVKVDTNVMESTTTKVGTHKGFEGEVGTECAGVRGRISQLRH